MKKILAFFLCSFSLHASDIVLSFHDLRSEKGEVYYLLFDKKEGFPDEARASVRQGHLSAIKAQKEGIRFEGLENGQYGLSVFHDENSNGKLDTNFIGIPKEGFGFSQNPTILFGPPSFQKASFDLNEKVELKIKMTYF